MDSSQPVIPPPAPTEPSTLSLTDRYPREDHEAADTGLADALAELPDQIELLADLDPAAAAEPGAAIADLLSRALEEEER